MNKSMNGKAIEAIYWTTSTWSGNPERVTAKDGKTLHLSATYHGDHEQFWVIECDNGQEVARHNAKTVDTIRWAKE